MGQYSKLFLQLLLLSAAASKLVTATSEAQALGNMNPVIWFLSERQVLVLVATLELVSVGVMWSRASPPLDIVCLVFFAVAFTGYRLAFLIGNYDIPCDCFGHVWQLLGLDTRSILVVNYVAYILYMGGITLFIWQRWECLKSVFRGVPLQDQSAGGSA